MVESIFTFAFIFVYYSIFFAFAAAHIAQTKGRSAFSWLMLGGLFGPFALVAIGFCESKETELRQREVQVKREAEMKEKRIAWEEKQKEIKQQRWGRIKSLFAKV